MKIAKLIYKDIQNQKAKSRLFTLLFAILSFTLSTSILLSINMANGYETMSHRLGHDVVVVPKDNLNNMESLLLQGKPSSFYIDKNIVDRISKIDGVESVTSQFYLKSLSASCCTIPIQIIRYDEDTDSSIGAWIEKTYGEHGLIVGSKIIVDKYSKIKLFGKDYRVKAQLAESNTGLDYSVYCDNELMSEMYKNALEKGAIDINISPQTHVSSIFIDVCNGVDIDSLMAEIDKLDEVRTIKANNIVEYAYRAADTANMLIIAYTSLFMILALFTIITTSSLLANSRKKEFATLRIIGGTKRKIRMTFTLEQLILSLMGEIAGYIVSAAILIQFRIFIGQVFNMPFAKISMITLANTFVVVVIISSLISYAAATISFVKIGSIDNIRTLE